LTQRSHPISDIRDFELIAAQQWLSAWTFGRRPLQPASRTPIGTHRRPNQKVISVKADTQAEPLALGSSRGDPARTAEALDMHAFAHYCDDHFSHYIAHV
jgi:hypothetical protein